MSSFKLYNGDDADVRILEFVSYQLMGYTQARAKNGFGGAPRLAGGK